jgi:hypothetical protein
VRSTRSHWSCRLFDGKPPHSVEIVFLDSASDYGSLRFARGLEEIEARDGHLFTEKRGGKFHAMGSETELCKRQLDASSVGVVRERSHRRG